jgi:DNA-binding transcriptional ArsR family regulator
MPSQGRPVQALEWIPALEQVSAKVGSTSQELAYDLFNPEDSNRRKGMASVKQSRPLDATLGAIVSHPLRARCLVILSERVASPTEIATELGEDVGTIAYHVKVLKRCNCIELVDTAQRRGATEHYYRGTKRPHLSDEEFANLSLEDRLQFARLILQFSLADAAISLEATTFSQRPDHHISRAPVTVDEQGWEELREIYADSLQRTLDVQTASAERMASEPDAVPIPTRVVTMVFEMPKQNRQED